MRSFEIRKFIISLVIVFLGFGLVSCTVTHVETLPLSESPMYDVAAVAVPPPDMRQGLYHVVAPGETLWRIAQMYEVDAETVKKANRIRDARDIGIGKKLYIPGAASMKHVVSLYPGRRWRYIIMHHSATESGNSLEFNKAHLKRGWKGIGYHFVIDNGTCGKKDGQIEMSPRWIKQADGAHCKANGMNEKGIGICLVGNFSKDRVSRKQMDSLVYLVNKLRGFYHIPKKRIMGHGQVPGARTECPGTKFPWKRFRKKLGR